MLSITQKQDPYEKLGDQVGGALGMALSSASSRAAQQRAFESLGIPKDQAQKLTSLPPDMQQEVVKGILGSRQRIAISKAYSEGPQSQYQQTPPSEVRNSGGQRVGEVSGRPLPKQPRQFDLQKMMQDQSFAEPMMEVLRGQGLDQLVGRQLQQPGQPGASNLQGLMFGESAAFAEKPKSDTQQLIDSFESPNFATNLVRSYYGEEPLASNEFPQAIKPKEEKGVAEHAYGLEGLDPESQMKVVESRMKSAKDFRANRMAEHKDSNKYHEKVMEKYRSAKEDSIRLDRMAKLVNKGKLDPSGVSSLLDMLDNMYLNLDTLRSPDSQEFNKLSKEFIKGARAIFGSRITNSDLKHFMKMIPTLTQTQEGKVRVLNNLKAMARGATLRGDVMNAIADQNGGYRPIGIESQVEGIVKPELDKLSGAFTQGYEEYKLKDGFKKKSPQTPTKTPTSVADLLINAAKNVDEDKLEQFRTTFAGMPTIF